jgi:hypothetical protein
MGSRIIVSTVPSDFKDYDTVNLRIQYTEEITGGSGMGTSSIKIQNSAKLKQIENRAIYAKPAILNELKSKMVIQHTDNIIGDDDSRYDSTSPPSKYKKMKEQINKEIEEKQALADANKSVSAQVAGNFCS